MMDDAYRHTHFHEIPPPLGAARIEVQVVYSKRYPTYEFVFVVLPHPRNHYDNNLLVIRRSELETGD